MPAWSVLTCTTIRGLSRPNGPRPARISTPWSAPGGLSMTEVFAVLIVTNNSPNCNGASGFERHNDEFFVRHALYKGPKLPDLVGRLARCRVWIGRFPDTPQLVK